jgi:hypothetical protein
MNMQRLLANKFGIPRSQMPQLQQWKLMEPACEFISHIVLALAYSTLLGHKRRRAPRTSVACSGKQFQYFGCGSVSKKYTWKKRNVTSESHEIEFYFVCIFWGDDITASNSI